MAVPVVAKPDGLSATCAKPERRTCLICGAGAQGQMEEIADVCRTPLEFWRLYGTHAGALEEFEKRVRVMYSSAAASNHGAGEPGWPRPCGVYIQDGADSAR